MRCSGGVASLRGRLWCQGIAGATCARTATGSSSGRRRLVGVRTGGCARTATGDGPGRNWADGDGAGIATSQRFWRGSRRETSAGPGAQRQPRAPRRGRVVVSKRLFHIVGVVVPDCGQVGELVCVFLIPVGPHVGVLDVSTFIGVEVSL